MNEHWSAAGEPLPTAERWRLKAEECRALALQMHERSTREAFQRLADCYEHRADQLEDRAKHRGLRPGQAA